MSAATRRVRRKRRQAKQTMKHGKRAKRRHARVAGRTGSVQTKKLRSRRPPHAAMLTQHGSLAE